MKKLLMALSASVLLAAPVFAQNSPPKPTPEQLAKVFEEDQLSLEKCGEPAVSARARTGRPTRHARIA